jgi:hypothetical protein
MRLFHYTALSLTEIFFLEKPRIAQQVKNNPHFIETHGYFLFQKKPSLDCILSQLNPVKNSIAYFLKNSVNTISPFQNSSIGIATGYWLNQRDSIPDKIRDFSQRPDRVWVLPNLL